jgi:hypothetical protein
MEAETMTEAGAKLWPELPLAAWQDTYATLHMWTQVVGKVRLELAPSLNHWWNVTLYVSPCGLTTGPIPYGERIFELEFDFIAHRLLLRTDDGTSDSIPLRPQTVADFYAAVMELLRNHGVEVRIYATPVEVADPIPFESDTTHRSYDPEYANRLWRILVRSDCVMKEFRSRFIGKSSPVHFFWGSFDLAVTRFSGRRAPVHPGAPNVSDSVTREAYSHEVSSCGFWPGGGSIDYPAYYAYAYPEPEGFGAWRVQPDAAFYDGTMREFFLSYDVVRMAADPDGTLLTFLQSTYEAAAVCGKWDRESLER